MVPIIELILIHPLSSAFRSKGVTSFRSEGHSVEYIVKQSICTMVYCEREWYTAKFYTLLRVFGKSDCRTQLSIGPKIQWFKQILELRSHLKLSNWKDYTMCYPRTFKCKHVGKDLPKVWNFQGQSMTCDMRKKLKCRSVNNFWHWKLWSLLSIRKNFQNTCIYFKNNSFKGVGIFTVMSKLSKWAWTTPLGK